jgi:hypothetical protein
MSDQMGDNVSENFDDADPPTAAPDQDAACASASVHPDRPPPVPSGPPPVATLAPGGKPVQQHPFSLSPVNVVLFVVAAIYAIVASMYGGEMTAFKLGQATGKIFVLALIPILAGVIAWRCSGRKWRGGSIACSVTLVVVLLLDVMGSIVPPVDGPSAREILDGIEAKRDQVRRKAAESDDPREIRKAGEEYLDSLRRGIDRWLEADTGLSKEASEVIVAWINETAVIGGAWSESFVSVESERVLDYSILTSDAEFERQRGVVHTYILKTIAYNELYENSGPDLKKRLAAVEGGDSDSVREFVEGVMESRLRAKPIMTPLMTAHIEYGRQMIEVLNLLQHNKDQWTYQNDKLLFADAAVETRFAELGAAMLQNEETINTLSQKILPKK